MNILLIIEKLSCGAVFDSLLTLTVVALFLQSSALGLAVVIWRHILSQSHPSDSPAACLFQALRACVHFVCVCVLIGSFDRLRLCGWSKF